MSQFPDIIQFGIGITPADIAAVQQQVAGAATAGLAQALRGSPVAPDASAPATSTPGSFPSVQPASLFPQLQAIRAAAQGNAPANAPGQDNPFAFDMGRFSRAVTRFAAAVQNMGRSRSGLPQYASPRPIRHHGKQEAHVSAYELAQKDAAKAAKAIKDAAIPSSISDLLIAQTKRRNRESDKALRDAQRNAKNAPNLLSMLFGQGGAISPLGRLLGLRHHGWLTGMLRQASRGKIGEMFGGESAASSSAARGAATSGERWASVAGSAETTAATGAGAAAGGEGAAGGIGALLGGEASLGATGPVGIAVAAVAIALTVVVASIYAFASAMDAMVDKFGKYSAGASAAQAGYEIQAMQSNLQFAQALEPFMVEWIEFKTECLRLLTIIAVPAIKFIAEHQQGILTTLGAGVGFMLGGPGGAAIMASIITTEFAGSDEDAKKAAAAKRARAQKWTWDLLTQNALDPMGMGPNPVRWDIRSMMAGNPMGDWGFDSGPAKAGPHGAGQHGDMGRLNAAIHRNIQKVKHIHHAAKVSRTIAERDAADAASIPMAPKITPGSPKIAAHAPRLDAENGSIFGDMGPAAKHLHEKFRPPKERSKTAGYAGHGKFHISQAGLEAEWDHIIDNTLNRSISADKRAMSLVMRGVNFGAGPFNMFAGTGPLIASDLIKLAAGKDGVFNAIAGMAAVADAIREIKAENDFSEYLTYMKSINTEVKIEQDFRIQLQNENQVHGAVERLRSHIEEGMRRVADETRLRLGFIDCSLSATANV